MYRMDADGSIARWRHWSRSADSTVTERIRERSLLLDDLEEYTNSSERSRIRFATVESAERDQCCKMRIYLQHSLPTIDLRRAVESTISSVSFFSHAIFFFLELDRRG